MLESKSIEYGTIPTYTKNIPVRESDIQYTYEFNGWDTIIDEVIENKVYTATYNSSIKYYLITFNNYDGTLLQSSMFAYGSTPSYLLEDPIKPKTDYHYYVFDNWDTVITEVTGTKTYTAKFIDKLYCTLGLQFEYVSSTETYKIIGYTGTDKDVFCGPNVYISTFGEHDVTEVAANAFLSTKIISIILDNKIEKIGAGAFSNCTSLVSMSIPFVGETRGINDAENAVFGHIFGKTSATGLTSTTQSYLTGSTDEIQVYIPTSLSSVTITDETVISKGAFHNCNNISTLNITSTRLTDIKYYSFANTSKLNALNIPNSVTSIDEGAFGGAKSITSLTLDSGNANFVIENSCLIDINNKTILYVIDSSYSFPTNYEITRIGRLAFADSTWLVSLSLPNSITEIGYGAYFYCTGLTSIVLPKNLQTIEALAFVGCSNVLSVYLPTTLNLIDTNAFLNCTKIANVYYSGTSTQWISISKGSGNTNLLNASKVYNYDY